jgi:hypothetical protein
MRRFPAALRFTLAAFALLMGGACTVVRIETPSRDDVEVQTRFGIVNLELRPGSRNLLVESTSFGAIGAFDGFSVGYRNASYVSLGQGDCRVVLWIRSDEDLQELNQLLRDRTDVCVLPATSLKGGK